MTQIWLAVDEDGTERISNDCLVRDDGYWFSQPPFYEYFLLPEGSIEKLIGRKLTWDDEAVMVEN